MKNYSLKVISIFISLCSLLLHTKAQDAAREIKELKIGDQCPDFVFSNIINWHKQEARLSDFKGKLVILDFWATWCAPCVGALPKMDSLQKKFGNRIVILPVTRESTTKASDFFKTSKYTSNTILPSITYDSTLVRYFPHRYIPHEVWIDEKGKVLAITGGDYVNQQNIGEYFKSNALNLPVKVDNIDLRDLDAQKLPFLAGGLGKDFQFDMKYMKYYSLLTDYLPGSGSANSKAFVHNGLIQIRYVNAPIDILYRRAFWMSKQWDIYNPKFYLLQPARVILDVKDSSLFSYPGKEREPMMNVFRTGRVFCYQLYAPEKDSLKISNFMVEDLNRYFGSLYGFEGKLEKRKVKYWALRRTTSQDLMKTHGDTPYVSSIKSRDSYIAKNQPLKRLVHDFTVIFMFPLKHPIEDETGYSGNVDIEIKGTLSDPATVNKSLKKYGLEFVFTEGELDMVVISDK